MLQEISLNTMVKVTKTKNQNNRYEYTHGDTFKHYGSGDQNVDKRSMLEKKSHWKDLLIAIVAGLVVAVAIWYFRLNGVR